MNRAVKSAINLKQVDEIVLVEDGSDDDSLAACEKVAADYPQVKLYTHANHENMGAGPSRNLGIARASNDIIAFLDADDYYLPNRFEQACEILKSGDIDGVYEASARVALNAKGVAEASALAHPLTSVGTEEFDALDRLESGDLFHSFFLRKFKPWNTNTITLRKSSLDKYQLRFEGLRLHQDTLLWIKCAYYLNLVPGETEKPVAVRTYHGANRIANTSFESRSVLEEALFQWAKTIKLSEEERWFMAKRRAIYNRHRKFINGSAIPRYAELAAGVVKNYLRLKLGTA